MENIPEEIITRLDTLAAKLGVAIEHLWPAIVQHTQLNGLSNILIGMVVATSAWIACRFLGKRADDADFKFGVQVVTCIIIIIAFATGLNGGLDDLLAPEGASVKMLLKWK